MKMIDIETLRDHKKKLEEKLSIFIFSELSEFEIQNGILIDSVSVDLHDITVISERDRLYACEVHCNIKI
jgi:hypothetical protein